MDELLLGTVLSLARLFSDRTGGPVGGGDVGTDMLDLYLYRVVDIMFSIKISLSFCYERFLGD